MRKKELAKIIIERLKEEYPDADCTLDYNDAWKLLISVRLAAQCTDARVNVVVPHLYEKFPTIDALANADVSEIEEIVRPCGLGRSKARDISLCMRINGEGDIDKSFGQNRSEQHAYPLKIQDYDESRISVTTWRDSSKRMHIKFRRPLRPTNDTVLHESARG